MSEKVPRSGLFPDAGPSGVGEVLALLELPIMGPEGWHENYRDVMADVDFAALMVTLSMVLLGRQSREYREIADRQADRVVSVMAGLGADPGVVRVLVDEPLALADQLRCALAIVMATKEERP